MNDFLQEYLLVGALRYYMGRSGEGVVEFIDLLINNWEAIDYKTQEIIKRDLDKRIRDHEEWNGNIFLKPLNMDCYYKKWKDLHDMYKSSYSTTRRHGVSIDDEPPYEWDKASKLVRHE